MKPFDIRGILPLWTLGQETLPTIVRWSKYVKLNPHLRTQNTLEHSWALGFFGWIVLSKLRGIISLDEGLLLGALNIHDISEGILKEGYAIRR